MYINDKHIKTTNTWQESEKLNIHIIIYPANLGLTCESLLSDSRNEGAGFGNLGMNQNPSGKKSQPSIPNSLTSGGNPFE